MVGNEECVVEPRLGNDAQAVAPVDDRGRLAAPTPLAEEVADPPFDRGPAFLLAHAAGDEDDRAGLAVIDEVLHDVIDLVGAERQDEEVHRPGHGLDRGDAAAALDRSDPGFDDGHVGGREAALEDVIEDDVADVHLLGDADDADRGRLEQSADALNRPG